MKIRPKSDKKCGSSGFLKKKYFFCDIASYFFHNFSKLKKKLKNDDVIKLIGNQSLDANEEEKVCEAVFSNGISPILRGGQYDPPPCAVR